MKSNRINYKKKIHLILLFIIAFPIDSFCGKRWGGGGGTDDPYEFLLYILLIGGVIIYDIIQENKKSISNFFDSCFGVIIKIFLALIPISIVVIYVNDVAKTPQEGWKHVAFTSPFFYLYYYLYKKGDKDRKSLIGCYIPISFFVILLIFAFIRDVILK